MKDAWGRGGYIESAVPRECKSYLPPEILWYTNYLDLDHLGKESLATAMQRNPKRWVESGVCWEMGGVGGLLKVACVYQLAIHLAPHCRKRAVHRERRGPSMDYSFKRYH